MRLAFTSIFLLVSLFLSAQICPIAGTCGTCYIADVSVDNGFSNPTNVCSPGGFGDFKGQKFIEITPDGVFTLSVATNCLDVFVSGWVDWNGDETFDQTEVLAFAGTSVTGHTAILSNSLGGANVGDTVAMRIVLSADPTNIATDPCDPGLLFYCIEGEDYSVVITDTPTTGDDYCDAAGNDCGYGFISNVDFAGQQNASTCTFYGDYTDQVYFKVEQGGTEVLTIDWGNSFPNYLCAAWIDYNQDNVFSNDEITPLVINESTEGATGVVLIPDDAKIGLTRMRIRMVQNDVPSACGEQSRGEVEDYSVIINGFVDKATSPFPADSSSGHCQDGLELSWDKSILGDEPEGYKLSLGTDFPPKNLLDSLDVGLDTFYHILSTLQPNKTYYWQVVPYTSETEARNSDIWRFTTSPKSKPEPIIVSEQLNGERLEFCSGISSRVILRNLETTNLIDWSGSASVYLSSTSEDTVDFMSSSNQEDTLILSVTDEFGCSSLDTFVTKVHDLPETGSIQGELAECTGDDFEFLHSGTQNEIKWILKRSAIWEDIPEANTLGLVYKNAQDGDLISTVINDEFCSDTTEAVTLTVHEISDAPDITANLIQGKICEGSDAGLVSSKGASSIWSTEEMAESISVSESGEYWVYYLDDNNCPSDTAYIEVGVIPSPPKPVVNELEAGENNFCEGRLVTLTVSDLGFDINWVNQNINNQTLITLQNSTVVVVTYTDEFGCKSTSETYEVQFRENPEEPQIFNSDDFQFCKGDSTVLFTNSQDQVTWNDGNNTTGKELVVKFPGRYRAFVVNEFMCENRSEFVEVEELAVPNKPSFELSNLEFCDGDSVQLSANSEVSIFRDGAFVADSKDVYVSTPGHYHVVKNAVNGCSAVSDTIMLIENALPEKPTAVIPSGNAEMCEGDSILIVEVGGREVYWNDGTNELKQKIYVHTEGDYYAETRNEKCVNRSDAISVKVNPNPEFPYLYINGDSLQTINTEGYLVQWYYTNGAEVPNGDNEAILYDSSKDYYVEFTDPSTGCSTMSEVYLGLTEFQAKLSLKLYPNPVRKGDLVGFELNENTDFVLSVYDLNGRRVLTSTNEKISTIDLALGTYSVILESDKGNYYGKLVVM